MTDADLRVLLAQPPDHRLDSLQADIWAGIAERERRARASRQLLVLQSVVLISVLAASLLAGARWSHVNSPGPLDVFSPRMALSISTRLTDSRP